MPGQRAGPLDVPAAAGEGAEGEALGDVGGAQRAGQVLRAGGRGSRAVRRKMSSGASCSMHRGIQSIIVYRI